MAKDTKTTGSTRTPDASNLRSQLTDALAKADGTAAGGVQHLQRVYQARASQLSRTAAGLKAMYGAKDAGVIRAEAALSAAKAVSSQLAVVHRQLTTPEPEVAPEGWVLHGHVYVEKDKPAAGFTVLLANAANAYQQAYGFASTDDTGYFRLKHDGERAASAGKSAPKEAPVTELFIEVFDLKGRFAYQSKEAFEPVTGKATYQDIDLSKGNRARGTLPASIPRVDRPKPKPKK